MSIECRVLGAHELSRVREIDRTEAIDELFVQRGSLLELRRGDWSARSWSPEGEGEHSVAAQQAALEDYVRRGGLVLGAFDDERLVGIGAVVTHLRPGIAQLAYLHVTDGHRARGIGGRLTAELERVAQEAGDTSIVVSATPSRNTVRFYRGQGYVPTATPLPELLALEPEDIHMVKSI